MSTMPTCIDCKQEMTPSERYGEGAFRCPNCDGEDEWFYDNVFRNKHGVLVRLTVCSHWVNAKTGKPSRTYTPKVCWDCPEHDTADVGEYGEIFGPPYCTKNVWLPTKSNKCKIKDKVK